MEVTICGFQLDDAKCDFQPTKLKNILEVIEQKLLSDEGSNSVQRQPQRLKAFAQKILNAAFITNLVQKPSTHLGVRVEWLLQNLQQLLFYLTLAFNPNSLFIRL